MRNWGSLTTKVHTSLHKLYVERWPCTLVRAHAYATPSSRNAEQPTGEQPVGQMKAEGPFATHITPSLPTRTAHDTHLDSRLLLDALLHTLRQRLVELPSATATKRQCTCWRTLIASWGGMSPDVISSSSESVSAVPILVCQCMLRARNKPCAAPGTAVELVVGLPLIVCHAGQMFSTLGEGMGDWALINTNQSSTAEVVVYMPCPSLVATRRETASVAERWAWEYLALIMRRFYPWLA